MIPPFVRADALAGAGPEIRFDAANMDRGFEMRPNHRLTRRELLVAGVSAFVAILTPDRGGAAVMRAIARGRADHPDPRPGIDGSKVLATDQLHDPALAPLFDGIRRIPQIADGIRCACGCAESPEFRSLLTCYENGMAMHCAICQTEGRIAVRMHDGGKTLEEIRAALDARFG